MRNLLPAALAALGGCGPDSSPVVAPRESAAGAAVVVADISPGTNPYHEAFRRPGWTEHPSRSIPGFPADVPALPLTLGDDAAAALAADQAVWASYRKDQLYWVPGTNLLLFTANNYTGPDTPDGRTGPLGVHGSRTSSVVAASCPDCWVLVVQDWRGLGGAFLATVLDRMPWVDLVTQTNFPATDADVVDFYTTAPPAQATRALERSGRQYFAGTANGILLSLGDVLGPIPVHNYDVPPWVVSVGGVYRRYFYEFSQTAYESCHLIEHFSGKPAEFVGNWQHRVAAPLGVRDYAYVSGTSFATPEVAGRFGQVLLELRRALGDSRAPGALWAGAPVAGSAALADGRLTPAELRAAMAQTAQYFSTADFDDACLATLLATGRVVTPASPAPWIEMGWGYVTPESVPDALALLLGQGGPEAKPAAASAWMQAVMAVRSAIYAAYPPGG